MEGADRTFFVICQLLWLQFGRGADADGILGMNNIVPLYFGLDQNVRQILSCVKVFNVVGGKMARNGRKMANS